MLYLVLNDNLEAFRQFFAMFTIEAAKIYTCAIKFDKLKTMIFEI